MEGEGRMKWKLLSHVFSDAIEWQESLVGAHTLDPWEQTKLLTIQADKSRRNIRLYRELWKQILKDFK